MSEPMNKEEYRKMDLKRGDSCLLGMENELLAKTAASCYTMFTLRCKNEVEFFDVDYY